MNVLIYQTAAHARELEIQRVVGRKPLKSEADILIKLYNLVRAHGS